jgi:hypothetical protein
MDIPKLRAALAADGLALVGLQAWEGLGYLTGSTGERDRVHTVTLGHLVGVGQQVDVETAVRGRTTTVRQRGDADGRIDTAQDQQVVILDGREVIFDRLAPDYTLPDDEVDVVTQLVVAAESELDGLPDAVGDIAIELRDVGLDEFRLVSGVDPTPYLEATAALEAARRGPDGAPADPEDDDG